MRNFIHLVRVRSRLRIFASASTCVYNTSYAYNCIYKLNDFHLAAIFICSRMFTFLTRPPPPPLLASIKHSRICIASSRGSKHQFTTRTDTHTHVFHNHHTALKTAYKTYCREKYQRTFQHMCDDVFRINSHICVWVRIYTHCWKSHY